MKKKLKRHGNRACGLGLQSLQQNNSNMDSSFLDKFIMLDK